MQYSMCRAVAEISSEAVARNFQYLKGVAEQSELYCVIKANAYGHGATVLARLYETLRADGLAVATAEEALSLRGDGITLPILILGYVPPVLAPRLAGKNISVCLYSEEHGQALTAALCGTGARLSVHAKIDTGMHRLGFSPDAEGIGELVRALYGDRLVLDGCFTHFHSAEKRSAIYAQLGRFGEALGEMAARGLVPRLRHAAASAAILTCRESHLDMVRAGLALYGLSPVGAPLAMGLCPALTLKARVIAVRRVMRGEIVGYGGAFIAPRNMRIATLAIGYADGLRRDAAARGLCVAVGGARLGLVGRVCMDMCTVDATDAEIAVGDMATVYGVEAQGVGEAADACDTIAYELLTAIGPRVARVYV